MKAFALLLSFVFLSPALVAQTNNVAIPAPKQASRATNKTHRPLMQRIFGTNVTYGGVLTPRSKWRHASIPVTGQTFDNVCLPPISGRAEGITVLSVHY